jgi:hypothetical protein
MVPGATQRGNKMESFAITHPQAAAAVRLAHAAQYMDRATIARRLAAGDIPRPLFRLACQLRAASAKGL